MKKILVPLAVNTDDKGQVAYFVRPNYLRALENVGLEPVLVSGDFTEEQLIKAYEVCGGVLFMGGWDINPKYYGEESHQKTRWGEPNRDAIEMKILSWVKRDKKPFLGICRGEQVLNVGFGGNLIQHLPEQTVEQHSVGSYEKLGEVRHKIKIETGSRLYEILGTEEMVVNSGHHQAVNRVGEGLLVVARSVGGVVEAIEGEDRGWFLLGVQWHPEAEKSENSTRIFRALAEIV